MTHFVPNFIINTNSDNKKFYENYVKHIFVNNVSTLAWKT
jgi:hypothetical protein